MKTEKITFLFLGEGVLWSPSKYGKLPKYVRELKRGCTLLSKLNEFVRKLVQTVDNIAPEMNVGLQMSIQTNILLGEEWGCSTCLCWMNINIDLLFMFKVKHSLSVILIMFQNNLFFSLGFNRPPGICSTPVFKKLTLIFALLYIYFPWNDK